MSEPVQQRCGRIIAAIDASAAARAVLSAATAVGELLGASVEALHVEQGRTEASQAAASRAGLPLRLVHGSPASSLALAGSEPDVCALAIGARASPLGKRPAGGTATELVLELGKPVVLVPPECPYPVRVRSLLIPLEASAVTLDILAGLIARACAAGCRITAVHVNDESAIPPFQDQPHHHISAWSQEFLRRYCSHPESVELLIRAGVVEEEVVAVAREVQTDLIVLVWHRDLRPGRAPLVRAVLERVQVPVLLFPATTGTAPAA